MSLNWIKKLFKKENKSLRNFNFLPEFYPILRLQHIMENLHFKRMAEEHPDRI